MKLSVAERLILIGILPEKSDYVTMRKIQEAKDALVFTDNEINDFGLEAKEGSWTWKNDQDVEVKIGEIADKEIVSSLKGRDERKELTAQELSLYGKFVMRDRQ